MSTALNSPEQRCLVRGVPYSAESGATFIRTTPEERERYKRLAAVLEQQCLSVEPKGSMDERFENRYARVRNLVGVRNADGTITHLTPEYWRHEWRSILDYEGPPMRAPSGPVFELFDATGTPAQEFSTFVPVYLRERITDAQEQAQAELLQHFAAMARRGECEFVRFGLIDATPKDAYVSPSAGGRGWCPKLAGVSE